MDHHLENLEGHVTSHTQNINIKVYKYRWVVLLIFGLYGGINFFQFMQFTIISNVLIKFYNTSSFLIDLTGLLFMISYIALFIPVGYLLERYNLKTTTILSSALLLIGNLLKLLGTHEDRLYVILIAQTLCGISQVFVLSAPAKIAGVWFGAKEVSTASALGVFGTQLGLAFGSLTSSLVVTEDDTKEEVSNALYNLFIGNAAFTGAIFIIIILFYQAKPALPPSLSQVSKANPGLEIKYFPMLKQLFTNKDYLLVLFVFGCSYGMWNVFGIIINTIYLHYFPGANVEVGLITLAAILAGGCLGSVIFGIILDKTHKFKLISTIALFGGVVTFAAVIVTLVYKAEIGSYISIPLFGFFSGSGMMLGFEYTLEASHPIPEAIGCSVLNATTFLFAIIFDLIFEALMDPIGFLATELIALGVLLCSMIGLYFISNNLRRSDANASL